MDNATKILLIEDNEADAFLITEALAAVESAAFEIACAERLSSGLECLAAGGIDAVLLDLSLPDSDGFATFARAHAHAPRTPIVVLSGADSEALAVRAVREGAQDYLVKGQVDGNLMARAIRYAVERKRTEEALRERTHDLNERVKKLSCLYTISDLLERRDVVPWEGILEEIVNLLPPAWQYPAFACARIIVEGQEFRTENFRETPWKQSSDIVAQGRHIGIVEVCYLEERLSGDEGPFLEEERNLLNTVAERLGEIIERKWAQEALQQRNRELIALNRAGHAISALLDPDQVLTTILEEVRRIMDVTATSIWLVDEETGELVCRQATGSQADVVRGWRLSPGEGIAGWTVRSSESQVVRDAWSDEHYFAGVDRQTGLPLHSILSTPLWAKQRVIGVLEVVDTEVGRFDEQDLMLLEPLAASAAVAIENAWLYETVQQELSERRRVEESLRRRNEELAALNAIAAAIGRSPDLLQALRDVLDEVVQLDLLKAPAKGAIFLLNGQVSELSIVAQRGFPKDHPCPTRSLRVGECLCGLAVQQGQIIISEDGSQNERHSIRWPGMVAHKDICLPLKARDSVLGALALELPLGQEVTDADLRLLTAIGDQIGVAIENARLAEEAAEVEILQEVNRLRSELIANVSHELRTPLGLIKVLCTTLLREDATEALDLETRREFLRDIDEEADKLEKIVDNLLNLSRIESTRMHLARELVYVGDLIGDLLVDAAAQHAEHRFRRDLPHRTVTAFIDSHQIEQVLRNLLDNAAKYSPEGGTITLGARGEKGQLHIWVSDQGIGIPPHDLEHVFERFYRVESEATRDVRGVGLGLAVCRGIVEAHGGRIWAESKLGKGSTFHLTLPVGEE